VQRGLSRRYYRIPESFSAHQPELDLIVDDPRADRDNRPAYIKHIMPWLHAHVAMLAKLAPEAPGSVAEKSAM
jgi:hypothetical protein